MPIATSFKTSLFCITDSFNQIYEFFLSYFLSFFQTFFIQENLKSRRYFNNKNEEKKNKRKKTMMYPSYTLDCNLYTKEKEKKNTQQCVHVVSKHIYS